MKTITMLILFIVTINNIMAVDAAHVKEMDKDHSKNFGKADIFETVCTITFQDILMTANAPMWSRQINARKPLTGLTPLMYACKNQKDPKVVEWVPIFVPVITKI